MSLQNQRVSSACSKEHELRVILVAFLNVLGASMTQRCIVMLSVYQIPLLAVKFKRESVTSIFLAYQIGYFQSNVHLMISRLRLSFNGDSPSQNKASTTVALVSINRALSPVYFPPSILRYFSILLFYKLSVSMSTNMRYAR